MARSVSAPISRRRMAALALGMSTAALTLSACNPGATDQDAAAKPSKSAAPTGVVTRENAQATIDRYEKVNNESNARRSNSLLSTVEGGQVNLQSAADYRQWKTWSAADRKQYGSPFFYRDRQFFIPAASSGVHWFAVAATATGSKDRAFLVFDKVGATYKLVASLYTDKKDPLPSIPVDRDGFVTPADPAKAVGDLAPNQVGAALSDLFATGGKKTGARLAATTASTSARKVYADRGKGKMSGFSTKRFFAKQPVHPEVYALRLAGGSVLAVFPSSHTAETMLKPPYMGSYKINPSDSEAVYDRTGRVVIVDEFQNLGLARLNPGGKAEVITAEYRMVDSR